MKLYLTIILLTATCTNSLAGTNFTALSESVKIVKLDTIEEQRREAQEASQKALSKAEIDKIKAQADEVISRASSSLEFYDWAFDQLASDIESPETVYFYLSMIGEQIHRDYAGRVTTPGIPDKSTLNDIRLAVKAKDYANARKIVQEAQARMQPGASFQSSSTTITRWHP